MDYVKINNTIDELSKIGQYSDAQLETIKYACYMPNFDETLIMDSSITSEIMMTYVELATKRKIDISKYINKKWHLKGFNAEQLYYLIFYNSKGYDIERIFNPNLSVEQMKEKVLSYESSIKFMQEIADNYNNRKNK